MHPLVGKNVPRRHSDGAGADGNRWGREDASLQPLCHGYSGKGAGYREMD